MLAFTLGTQKFLQMRQRNTVKSSLDNHLRTRTASEQGLPQNKEHSLQSQNCIFNALVSSIRKKTTSPLRPLYTCGGPVGWLSSEVRLYWHILFTALLHIIRPSLYRTSIETIVFLHTDSWKKTKLLFPNFSEHLAAIFRGMCVGWCHSSCDPVGRHERSFRVMAGISMPWSWLRVGCLL